MARQLGSRGGTTPPPARPLLAALTRGAIVLAGRLPLPVAHALGAAAGRALSLLPTRERRVTRRNLELAFPDASTAERARLERESLAHLGRMFAELGLLWTRPSDEALASVLRVDGGKLIEDALAARRPVLLLSLHLGSWEAVSLWCSRFGMASAYRLPRVRELDAFVRASRERLGAQFVSPGTAGVRRLLEKLRSGGMAGFACDQDPGEGGIAFAPFLGVDAATSTLPARLASSTDALVVIAWGERVPGRGFVLHVERAPDELAQDDPIAGTRALNEALTRLVRSKPEQYLWSYKRFRARLGGEWDDYR